MGFLKGFANFIAVIISIVLSIALLAVLICAPILSTVTKMTETESIQDLAGTIDYAELARSMPEIADTFRQFGIEGETLNQLMHTELANEIIGLAADCILTIAEGGKPEAAVLSQQVGAILQTHIGDLTAVLQTTVPDGVVVTDDMIRPLLTIIQDALGTMLAESLPTAESLGIEPEVSQAITVVRSGLLMKGVLTAIAALSILILVLRFVRFKGFMWLGVIYILGAVFSALEAVAASFAISSASSVTNAYVNPVILNLTEQLSKNLWTPAAIMLACGILFIVIFAFGRTMMRKRRENIDGVEIVSYD